MSMDTDAIKSRGRPMSVEAGNRILDAAIALLGDEGWEGLSMEALAARAGVGKATIYRRWSSREGIVVAALERFVDEIRVPDTGSLREDLTIFLSDAVRAYLSSRGTLVPALASAMERHPELAEAVRRKFLEPRRRVVLVILRRARDRGQLTADADLDIVHDLLAGPFVYRRLFTGMPLDGHFVRTIADAIVSAFGSANAQ